MDTKVAGVTAIVVDPTTEPDVAVTLVLPTKAGGDPLIFTTATPVFPLLQVPIAVMVCVLPSV